jgi:arginyl-tRNA synthetase
MYDKADQIATKLEERLTVLEQDVDNLLNENIKSERLTALRQENSKLKYRLEILMRSISEEEAKAGVGKAPSLPTSPQRKAPPKSPKGIMGGGPDPSYCVDVSHVSVLVALKEWFGIAMALAFPTVFDVPVMVTQSTKEAFGDYQFNSAMSIAQALGKMGQKTNPRAVAVAIKEKLPENSNVEKVDIAGPGFINVFLKARPLSAQIVSLFTDGIPPPRLQRRQRVIVDFSSPNIAKEMHVGHLRSTIIGDCICRLLEWAGHDVLRLNHIGDWGTQFGMLIAHLEDRYPNLLADMPPVSDLMMLYKESKVRFDSCSEFNKRAHDCVVRLQGGEPAVVDAWKAICQKSREEFEKIYNMFDIKVIERGESFYQERMNVLVKELRAKGMLEKCEGRELFFPTGMEVPLTVVKSDGSYTYDTSDLATLRQRIEEERADWIIYVVDAGQALHFQTIFAGAEEAGILDPSAVRVNHVAFGLVLGEDKKKLKTRSGESIKLASLIQEGLLRSAAKLAEKDRAAVLSPEELRASQEAVAYGCIKYSDLVHNRNNDYIFSFDRMLDDRGNTAAYLLYAYARIRSIARNAGVTRDAIRNALSPDLCLEHPKELKLAKTILRFWDTIVVVLEDLFPHVLCEYLYELACVFTEFYDCCYCIEKDADGNVKKINYHRLMLSEVTADVIATCFNILGIRTVQKM